MIVAAQTISLASMRERPVQCYTSFQACLFIYQALPDAVLMVITIVAQEPRYHICRQASKQTSIAAISFMRRLEPLTLLKLASLYIVAQP